jgi:hypothetical protein
LTNLKIFVSESFRFKVRSRICCRSSKTRPTPNSIAEKMRKKNVRDRIFRLSYTSPTNKTMEYSVIQRSSAVNNKCNAVFVLINKLPRIKKKKINRVFKSPKNKIN